MTSIFETESKNKWEKDRTNTAREQKDKTKRKEHVNGWTEEETMQQRSFEWCGI